MTAVYLAGHGHHWPGGAGGLGERFGGPNVSPVSGNELVWEFCRRHHL
jgi:poly(3-hydroxybutyrate) depolymerase